MGKFIYDEYLFHNLKGAQEFFRDYEDDKLPEALQWAKPMRTSDHIDVDSLVDGMLLRLEEGECGADEFCTEDGGIAEHATYDEVRMLKGFVTLWLDNLKFKMYIEDDSIEPYPFKVNEIAERTENRRREHDRKVREAAELTRAYLAETTNFDAIT